MGTDISAKVERRHPEYGWVCSWLRLKEARDYDLFSLLQTYGHSGLPGDCTDCSKAFFEDYNGSYFLTLTELKGLVAEAKDYDLSANLHALIKELSQAKKTARVIGDHEDKDDDVRMLYAFWR